jgi:hypothetical protein
MRFDPHRAARAHPLTVGRVRPMFAAHRRVATAIGLTC